MVGLDVEVNYLNKPVLYEAIDTVVNKYPEEIRAHAFFPLMRYLYEFHKKKTKSWQEKAEGIDSLFPDAEETILLPLGDISNENIPILEKMTEELFKLADDICAYLNAASYFVIHLTDENVARKKFCDDYELIRTKIFEYFYPKKPMPNVNLIKLLKIKAPHMPPQLN